MVQTVNYNIMSADEIRDSNSVALGKRRVFVAVPATDRLVFFPYLHIAAIETIENGHPPRRKRRR